MLTLDDPTGNNAFTGLPGNVFDSDPDTSSPFTETVTACVCSGALIATPSGEVKVETLQADDLVLTASGEARPIRWMGYRDVVFARHAAPKTATPIRVAAGALGDNLPARDLFLSPDHAVLVEGRLIPIRHLVDDREIAPAPCESVRYWHVELYTHDIILAEGLPCESYLDTGNRGMFQNAPVADLHPNFAMTAREAWSARACAPLLEDGPELERLRAALAARRDAAPRVQSVRIDGSGTSRFRVEPGVTSLRLLCDAVDGVGDPRRRGALVTAIRLDGVRILMRDPRLLRGFHEIERHGRKFVRWTDGEAWLRLDPCETARELEIDIFTLARRQQA